MAGFCERDNEPFGSMICGDNAIISRLLASPQELVCLSLDAFTYSKTVKYGRSQIKEIPTET